MTAGALPLLVIPARANSSRFPGKILAPILQKPMIQYVWEAAQRARPWTACVVATDDEQIFRTVQGFGGIAELTPKECASGTDRVACIAERYPAEIIVNLQGDEPLLRPEMIDRLVRELEANDSFSLATLVVPRSDAEGLKDPNVVKAVLNANGEALYFSRQPLASGKGGAYFKHIGVYAFRRATLTRFCSLPPSPLEQVERLEQLRALEAGIRIKAGIVEQDTIAVDTPEDLRRVEAFMKKGSAGYA